MSVTVYRCYHGENLLYVGQSINPASRLRNHSLTQEWWEQIDRITLEHFATREEATEVESSVIAAEAPPMNSRQVVGGPTCHDLSAAEVDWWAGGIRTRRRQRGLTQDVLAERVSAIAGTHVGRSAVAHWERAAHAPALRFRIALADVLGIPAEVTAA